ncbi:hypothetical protein BDQ12DRAFT_659923 [Crucibulum laeve]|uniref:ER membrane protein complex subunit 2 n=1 Tax=Crucibulum laeve TaxID=68775 RepID=A0A5C3LFE7_9AGAR|nr:hypothetical protein BDQ12DRAFT_659923 [Crucibulum laeve]
MSLSSALQQLASYRANNTRASQETFKKGVTILKSRNAPNLGEDGWAFLEQLALASIDIGRLDVADECTKQLSEKFPNSPRVAVLVGIRKEASESPESVLRYYDGVLEEDSANAAIWKRRISVLKRIGKTEKAVDELSKFLDTFYTDVEGWLELADIYSSCNQYTSSLQALSHALVLAPQNPFTALQFAETAYTAGDLPLALKMFLVVTEMVERDIPAPEDSAPTGISVRAWWGVKLCSRRLIESPPSSPSASDTPVPKTIKLIDELATERVLTSYSGEQGAEGRQLVSQWISAY